MKHNGRRGRCRILRGKEDEPCQEERKGGAHACAKGQAARSEKRPDQDRLRERKTEDEASQTEPRKRDRDGREIGSVRRSRGEGGPRTPRRGRRRRQRRRLRRPASRARPGPRRCRRACRLLLSRRCQAGVQAGTRRSGLRDRHRRRRSAREERRAGEASRRCPSGGARNGGDANEGAGASEPKAQGRPSARAAWPSLPTAQEAPPTLRRPHRPRRHPPRGVGAGGGASAVSGQGRAGIRLRELRRRARRGSSCPTRPPLQVRRCATSRRGRARRDVDSRSCGTSAGDPGSTPRTDTVRIRKRVSHTSNLHKR